MSINVKNYSQKKKAPSCAAMFVDNNNILNTYDENFKILKSNPFGQEYNLVINSSLYNLPSVENWLPTCFAINYKEKPLIVTAKHTLNYCMRQTNSTNLDELFKKIKIVFGYDDTNNNHSIKSNEIVEIAGVYNNSYDNISNNNDVVILNINADNKLNENLLGTICKNSYKHLNIKVYTCGFPYGMPLYKSTGFIKGWSKQKNGYYITDLSAFDGHSGSPVFNRNKEIIGIVTSGANDFEYVRINEKNYRKLRYRKFNLDSENGIFVLPIDKIFKILN